jgi:hypothetical protein
MVGNKKITNNKNVPIIIEKFYLLKTAQILIEEVLEEIKKQFFKDNNDGKSNKNFGYRAG